MSPLNVHIFIRIPQLVVGQRLVYCFRRVFALGRLACAGEMLPLDHPKLLSIIKPEIRYLSVNERTASTKHVLTVPGYKY